MKKEQLQRRPWAEGLEMIVESRERGARASARTELHQNKHSTQCLMIHETLAAPG